jgi:hypothetical protein
MGGIGHKANPNRAHSLARLRARAYDRLAVRADLSRTLRLQHANRLKPLVDHSPEPSKPGVVRRADLVGQPEISKQTDRLDASRCGTAVRKPHKGSGTAGDAVVFIGCLLRFSNVVCFRPGRAGRFSGAFMLRGWPYSTLVRLLVPCQTGEQPTPPRGSRGCNRRGESGRWPSGSTVVVRAGAR